MSVLHQLRRAARHFGVEAERATPKTVWRLRLPALLEQFDLDLVLDVGANDGGYATDLLDNGYRGRIISFEPLPDAWTKVTARAARRARSQWTVAPRMALSDETGEADFFEAGNSVSSSLLTMTSTHVEAAPTSATVTSHRVPLNRLDDVLPSLRASSRIYLKLDVQGAEAKVLAGAPSALTGPIKAVQLEMSLATLYEGQLEARALDSVLREAGFVLWDIVPGFRNPVSLRLLQYDGIYVRQDLG